MACRARRRAFGGRRGPRRDVHAALETAMPHHLEARPGGVTARRPPADDQKIWTQTPRGGGGRRPPGPPPPAGGPAAGPRTTGQADGHRRARDGGRGRRDEERRPEATAIAPTTAGPARANRARRGLAQCLPVGGVTPCRRKYRTMSVSHGAPRYRGIVTVSRGATHASSSSWRTRAGSAPGGAPMPRERRSCSSPRASPAPATWSRSSRCAGTPPHSPSGRRATPPRRKRSSRTSRPAARRRSPTASSARWRSRVRRSARTPRSTRSSCCFPKGARTSRRATTSWWTSRRQPPRSPRTASDIVIDREGDARGDGQSIALRLRAYLPLREPDAREMTTSSRTPSTGWVGGLLSILYRDDALLAADKPSGLLVHRGMGRLALHAAAITLPHPLRGTDPDLRTAPRRPAAPAPRDRLPRAGARRNGSRNAVLVKRGAIG